jgi:glycosyltransferase involved in cell wall biosynthesis
MFAVEQPGISHRTTEPAFTEIFEFEHRTWRSLMSPKLSVVICSLNGAAGVDRCLQALEKQTMGSSLELIVVDDGSTDTTSDVGRAHEAIVIRHATNRGLAAARNSGVNGATAPIVAFLDDDCEPEPCWAERLLAAYDEDDTVIGVGGPILLGDHDGFVFGFLERNSPFKPQELNLAKSNNIFYRLYLYLGRQWTMKEQLVRRDVYSVLGGNMSFLRQALIGAGRFDERFSFGGEELDLCIRMRLTFPSGRIVFLPEARVAHHFKPSRRSMKPSLHDTLRRSWAYGRGSARLYRKWPSMPPTFFPGPLLVMAMLTASVRRRPLAMAALVTPHLLYPRGIRYAIASRSAASLLDAYVQLAQETNGNIGFLEGLWRFRHLVPDRGVETLQVIDAREGTGLVP